ncbi:MAG: sigma-70 family RNA polymerase sigma factor [Ruminococcus sp.]|nr:sigma-70 family RNA polymerase sigma factor [Ruminococcus sp.]
MTDNEYKALHSRSPRAAQNAFFDEYVNYVYAIVYNKLRSCGRNEDMEECVGDVFAAVFQFFDRNEPRDGDLKGIIGTIASRKAIEYFRRLSRRANDTVSIDDENFAEMPDSQNVHEMAERSEMRAILMRSIHSLGDPDSTMIIQKYYYNMNSRQISEKLSMSPDTVRVRLSRAVKKLKNLLSAQGIDLKEGKI